jgi:hypothetical protein
MKKLISLCAFIAMTFSLFGEGPQTVSIILNGGTPAEATLYKLNTETWTGNTLCTDLNVAPALNAKNFGTITGLVIDGGAMVTNGTGNTQNYVMHYRIYKSGDTAPAFATADTIQLNKATTVTSTDTRKQVNGKSRDVFTKFVQGSGTYMLDIQLDARTIQSATFTVLDLNALQASYTLDSKIVYSIGMTGISYTFKSTSLNATTYSWQVDGVDAGTANTDLTQIFTTKGNHIVKITAAKGTVTGTMEKTIKVFEQSAVNDKIVGGNMTDATKWIMVKLNNTQPTLTWNSTNAPTGATTALQIQKTGTPDRFALYQPVYLSTGKKYVFDALVKDILKSTATDVNLNLQLYISNTVLPTDILDPYDGGTNDAGNFGQLSTWLSTNNFKNIDGSYKASAVKGSAVTGDVCSFIPPAEGEYFVILRFTSWYSSGFNLAITNLSLTESSLNTSVSNLKNDDITIRSFSDRILILGAQQNVDLYDVAGRKLISETACVETVLNTSLLNNGVYIVVVDKKHSYKIVR